MGVVYACCVVCVGIMVILLLSLLFVDTLSSLNRAEDLPKISQPRGRQAKK
jgi:hypothetical protein